MLSARGDENDQVTEQEFEQFDLEAAVDEPDRVVPAIEFRNVHLAFDDKTILDGISFTVRRGETKVILGRSGGSVGVSGDDSSSMHRLPGVAVCHRQEVPLSGGAKTLAQSDPGIRQLGTLVHLGGWGATILCRSGLCLNAVGFSQADFRASPALPVGSWPAPEQPSHGPAVRRIASAQAA